MASFVRLPGAALGCDIDQMDQLSTRFTTSIEEVRAIMDQLDAQIAQTTWSGPDATNAEGEWEGTRTAIITQFQTQMDGLSQAIQKQRTEQESASGA